MSRALAIIELQQAASTRTTVPVNDTRQKDQIHVSNPNIKNGILYSGNPDTNPSARPLFSVGRKEVGDEVYLGSRVFTVTQVDIDVYDGDGELHRRGILAEHADTGDDWAFFNTDETNFTGIWE
jgi:hypothetical protein